MFGIWMTKKYVVYLLKLVYLENTLVHNYGLSEEKIIIIFFIF